MRLEVVEDDNRRMNVLLDGEEVFFTDYDEVGWGGLEAVERLVDAINRHEEDRVERENTWFRQQFLGYGASMAPAGQYTAWNKPWRENDTEIVAKSAEEIADSVLVRNCWSPEPVPAKKAISEDDFYPDYLVN